MKILVCGGRNYYNNARVKEVLDALAPTAVVHGAASGADAAAGSYARVNKIAEHRHSANWYSQGKAAGPMRNKEMLDMHPDIVLVVAFPGGKGTANMVSRAEARGIQILFVEDKVHDPILD